MTHDFAAAKDENGEDVLYEDSSKIYLPPSFKEF